MSTCSRVMLVGGGEIVVLGSLTEIRRKRLAAFDKRVPVVLHRPDGQYSIEVTESMIASVQPEDRRQ